MGKQVFFSSSSFSPRWKFIIFHPVFAKKIINKKVLVQALLFRALCVQERRIYCNHSPRRRRKKSSFPTSILQCLLNLRLCQITFELMRASSSSSFPAVQHVEEKGKNQFLDTRSLLSSSSPFPSSSQDKQKRRKKLLFIGERRRADIFWTNSPTYI